MIKNHGTAGSVTMEKVRATLARQRERTAALRAERERILSNQRIRLIQLLLKERDAVKDILEAASCRCFHGAHTGTFYECNICAALKILAEPRGYGYD